MRELSDLNERIVKAYELLSSIVQELDEPFTIGHEPNRFPAPVLQFDEKLSATDLLGFWFRPRGTSNPWDDYFDDTPPHSNLRWRRDPGHAHEKQEMSDHDKASERLFFGIYDQNHAALNSMVDEQDAEIVVENLYQFIHAVGRRDVDGAMAFIAKDYHVLDEDVEADYRGFRHQLKSWIDAFRNWEMTVTLAEIPHPIAHPSGFLVKIEIQTDARAIETDERKATRDKRLAVFIKQSNGDWLIGALSPLKD